MQDSEELRESEQGEGKNVDLDHCWVELKEQGGRNSWRVQDRILQEGMEIQDERNEKVLNQEW